MRMVFASRFMPSASYLSGCRSCYASGVHSTLLRRIIGIVAIMLWTGTSAFGQFIIQPMKVELGVYPGKRLIKRLAVENLSRESTENVDIRLVGMTQNPNGVWQEIEPDAEVIQDANGARWITVAPGGEEVRLDVSKLRSCERWLELGQDTVTLGPLQRKFVDLKVTIPPGKRGYYCAALMAETQARPSEDTGMRAGVLFRFLIPIIINVQGRPMFHDIDLTDVSLKFRAQTSAKPAATMVTLGIDNPGSTYSRLVGLVRVWGQWGGHWRKISDTRFPETGIIPGVTLDLREDVGRPLPEGKYKVEAFLYVNGKPNGRIKEEIDFSGDPRATVARGDAALELDPAEVSVGVRPGATRTTTMTVANASEETVRVNVAALLPEQMAGRVVVDDLGRTVRGEDLGCVDWLRVEPKEFTLRGYGRRNLRVIAQMPKFSEPRSNYYSSVQLKATYVDGTEGGQILGRIYVNTQNVQGNARIIGDDRQFSLAESAPSRYLVTAWFKNLGETYVLPRCRAVLTSVPDGGVRKRFGLSSQIFDQTGHMLPTEVRGFTGVLELADVSAGLYRLTAILEHDTGSAVQSQKAIRISDENGAKVVDVLDVNAIGGKTVIEL
jgi:hypothetical protein